MFIEAKKTKQNTLLRIGTEREQIITLKIPTRLYGERGAVDIFSFRYPRVFTFVYNMLEKTVQNLPPRGEGSQIPLAVALSTTFYRVLL